MPLFDFRARYLPQVFQINRYDISTLSFSGTYSVFYSCAKYVDMQNISLDIQIWEINIRSSVLLHSTPYYYMAPKPVRHSEFI